MLQNLFDCLINGERNIFFEGDNSFLIIVRVGVGGVYVRETFFFKKSSYLTGLAGDTRTILNLKGVLREVNYFRSGGGCRSGGGRLLVMERGARNNDTASNNNGNNDDGGNNEREELLR